MKIPGSSKQRLLCSAAVFAVVSLVVTSSLVGRSGTSSQPAASSASSSPVVPPHTETPAAVPQESGSPPASLTGGTQNSVSPGAIQNAAKSKIIFPTKDAWNNGVRNSSSGNAANAGKASPPEQLSYRGGKYGIGVTTGPPKVYLVFWGTQWGTKSVDGDGNVTFSGDPRGVAQKLQAMFKGLGTNNETWSNVMTQYCEQVAVNATSCPDSNGSRVGYPTGGALAGVWNDDTSAAPGYATQTSLALESVSAAKYFNNTTPASNRNVQYVIVSPTGTHPDGFNASSGFCAWHSGLSTFGYGPLAYTNLPYIPDAGPSCGAGYVNGSSGLLDGLTMVESHEYAETITDQFPSGGWTTLSSDLENGDLCSWVGVGGATGAQNITLSTGSFALQSTWSNSSSSCAVTASSVKKNTISLTTPSGQIATVQTPFTLQITAMDSGGAQMTYSATGLPAGLSIGSSTGLISGTPTLAGGTTVNVTVTDASGASVTVSFALTVQLRDLQAAPSTPLNVKARSTPTQLAVSWDPPSLGSPVLSYRVTTSPGGGVCTTTSTSCVVGGLVPGTRYQVTVSTTSANGAGAIASLFVVTDQLTSLGVGQSLTINQGIYSPDGRYATIMQSDGNLVTYGPGGVRWNTGTAGKGGVLVAFQGDGNVVMYTSSFKAVWASNSRSSRAGQLVTQNDGNFVAYNASAQPLWSSYTGPLSEPTFAIPVGAPTAIGPGTQLTPGQAMFSSNGAYMAIMQGDGNFVIYSGGGAVWSSGTSGHPGSSLAFQGDGNIVIYSPTRAALWATWSMGASSPSALVMQGDGNLVELSIWGLPMWASRR